VRRTRGAYDKRFLFLQEIRLTLIFHLGKWGVIAGGNHSAGDARAIVPRVVKKRMVEFDYVR
jgi:hypothetical protein